MSSKLVTTEGRGVDEVAQLINDVCRTATFDLAYKVGQLIIHELFESNVAAWRRDGTSRPSYRALASRSDLLLSPSALCRSVGVYVLTERLGGRQRWPHLSVSHLKEVLPLSECEQERLLDLAEHHRWTVAELRQQQMLASERGSQRVRSGGFLRTMRRLHAKVRDELKLLGTTECTLGPRELGELQRLVDQLQEQLVTLGRLARSEGSPPRAAEDGSRLLEGKHLVAEL